MIVVSDTMELALVKKAIDLAPELVGELAVVELKGLGLHLHVLRGDLEFQLLKPVANLTTSLDLGFCLDKSQDLTCVNEIS